MMPERSWTERQRNAIEARGGSLLVSAAAGSGKTSVLVERAVGLICDNDNPVDADRLLIVTFSIAAAAEARQRINARLSALIAQNPEDYGLLRQQALLQKAQISTVHAFCLSLIRENFHDLPVSPDFTIADTSELETMRDECAAVVIERFYEKSDPLFLELVELISGGRDDRRLTQTILKIYDFSRSHPFYESWLDEKAAMYRTGVPISETVWGKSILEYARESLELCYDTARSSLETLYTAEDKLRNAYLPAFSSDMRQLEDCLEFAHEGSWDDLAACLGDFVFERLGSVRGDDPMKERLKASRERVKNSIRELVSKYLCATEEQAADDLFDLAPKVDLLFELVKEFGRELDAAKAEKRRLDFSDLEHLALSLLVKKDALGYAPTVHAGETADIFDYVMVDEYQDTNEVQDLIFRSVSRRQENMFMVGDVKQSIYSFRQAMPEIFLEKRATFFRYDGTSYPAAISLDENFRSRTEVTEAVNFIFGRIMSTRVGEIEYNDDETLKPGADYPTRKGMEPELLLVAVSEYAGDLEPEELEAEAVADKINSMLENGFTVIERGEARPALPGDFCVLLRSPKNRADTYVRALSRFGIPAWAENAGGFLASREVMMALSILKALDNPLLDIELVAALMSPLFGFTDDDIARIRLTKRSGVFYSALMEAKNAGDEKAASFLELFEELRRGADSLPADRLILRIYEKTGALDIVRAMPSGESRRANLLLLVDYAAHYHAMGYKRLAGFISFMSRLEERGGDLGPASSSGGMNAVRILSVHKSKGLEFPVVILSDTARQFNREDLRSGSLLHSKYGFACARRDLAVMKQYPTVPMQAIRLESQRSLLSEEMRILYVALTRAKEKLIITSTVKQSLAGKLASLDSSLQNARLPAYLAGSAASCSDWILMSLLHHKSAGVLRKTAELDNTGLIDDGNPWLISVKSEFPDQIKMVVEAPSIHVSEPDEAIISLLKERAGFRYPYLAHTKIPVKLAVSTAARGERDTSRRFSARPLFLMEEELTAAERGNAMHKFMQFADYNAARVSIEDEIKRMRERAYLSPAETESLSAERLRGFFCSPLANRIFASRKVWRELRFMAEFGREELGGYIEDMDDEALVVLQGVADCVFLEDGGAVIVDYKTDRVKTADELMERYLPQLNLYKKILARSLGVPVKECIIYSFALSREIVAELP